MNNEKKFIKLTPFKMQVLQSFPFIDEDFDAITNYELLCKVVEYLNKTVDNVDLLNEKVEEFQNYFDNLDVQEEINNKLDDMAESGELADIIAQYLGLAGMLVYNNVNEMKQATNLVNGSICETLGFYNVNDKGGAKYKIRNITNEDTVDEITIIALSNINLIAELIIEDEMNVNQFGAKGDGITDDSAKIQIAINNCNKVLFPSVSYIAKEIYVSSNKTLDGLNNTIIMDTNTKLFTNNYTSENVESNITIRNFNIDCSDVTGNNQQNNVIYLCGVENCLVENINITDSKSDGIYVGSYNLNKTNKNVKISNCKITNSLRNNISIICGHVVIENCYFEDGTISTIDLEPNNIGEDIDVIIKDSIVDSGYINAYLKETIRDSVKINVKIENCKLSNNNSNLKIQYANHVDINNNEFTSTSSSNPSIELYTNANCNINNNAISGTNTISGIKNSSCSYSIVTGNNINGCKYGIEILNSSYCKFKNNNITNNATAGIYNRGTSEKNSYINNCIINGTNALNLDTGDYQIVSSNELDSNNASTTRSIVLGSNTSKCLVTNNIILNYSDYAVRDNGTDNVQDNNITN